MVGAGRMGITHCSILGAHPDVQIAAIVDTSSVINSLIEKYLRVPTYRDFGQMLASEKLDALLISTPPAVNGALLAEAGRAGLHAFVEKPYTTSTPLAIELADLFESRGLVNQVGYVNRFNDVFRRVKSILEAGTIGNVLRFQSEMHSRTIIRAGETSGWRGSHAQGGGAVYEMASHAIDLMNFLFGRPDKVVGTRLSRVFSSTVEDIVTSSFLYRNGAAGSLYVNWSDESFRKPTNKIEIVGTAGKIFADQHGLKVYVSGSEPRGEFKPGWTSLSITDIFSSVPFFVRGNEFTAQLFHFVECIKSGKGTATDCTFRDAAATLAVIDSMFADDAGNQP